MGLARRSRETCSEAGGGGRGGRAVRRLRQSCPGAQTPARRGAEASERTSLATHSSGEHPLLRFSSREALGEGTRRIGSGCRGGAATRTGAGRRASQAEGLGRACSQNPASTPSPTGAARTSTSRRRLGARSVCADWSGSWKQESFQTRWVDT